MFGLTELSHAVHPVSTFDKFMFLVENVFTHYNGPTTVISFTALGALVFLRYIKTFFQKQWYIYRIPEVLVVVIVSTSKVSHFTSSLHR